MFHVHSLTEQIASPHRGILLVPQERLKESRIRPGADPLLKSLPSACHRQGLLVEVLEQLLVELEWLQALVVHS